MIGRNSGQPVERLTLSEQVCYALLADRDLRAALQVAFPDLHALLFTRSVLDPCYLCKLAGRILGKYGVALLLTGGAALIGKLGQMLAAAGRRAVGLARRVGRGMGKAWRGAKERVRRWRRTPKNKVTRSVGELRSAGIKDAHHVIQDAAVRDLPGYSTTAAPGVQLPGPSTLKGSPHYRATRQQALRGGGTYAAERRIAYRGLRRAGYGEAKARQAIQEAGSYFRSIGVGRATPTRIPGGRRGG